LPELIVWETFVTKSVAAEVPPEVGPPAIRFAGLTMPHFRNICLLKAPQAFAFPHPQDISDLTELCYLAAIVQNDVESVCIPLEPYSKNPCSDLAAFLKRNNNVDLVGISTMTGAFNNALRLAETAKRFGKYVVMGGYHPTALASDVLESPHVDCVVVGEGELTFHDLVINGPSMNVPGLAFKHDGQTVFTQPRPVIADLDSLPHPLRSARPTRFGESGDAYSIDTIYTSRGCPWTCTFCANRIMNKQWRARSPENVLEELAQIHDPRRTKYLKIWDANFLTSISRVERLCDLMLENKLTNFTIYMETRVNDVVRAKAIMDKLVAVGLRHASLGIESPNAETLRLMNKKNTDAAVVEAADILNNHNIKIVGYFIIGHYSETVEDTRRYPEYAERLGLRYAVFMVMTPYPGTEIFQEYKEQDRIKSYDWDLYNNLGTVVSTRHMDTAQLRRMHMWCWGRFYVKWGFVNERTPQAFAAYILYALMTLHTILKLDRTNTDSDIEDYLFEMLTAGVGEHSRAMPARSSRLLKLFSQLTIRFHHSDGRNIDMTLSLRDNREHIRVRESHGKGWIKGFSIDMRRVCRLARHMTPGRTLAVAGKTTIAKTLLFSPGRKLMKRLSFCFDRDFVSLVFFFGHYMLPVLVKGWLSLALTSTVVRDSAEDANGDADR